MSKGSFFSCLARRYGPYFGVVLLSLCVNAWLRHSAMPFSPHFFLKSNPDSVISFKIFTNQSFLVFIRVIASYLGWLFYPSFNYPVIPNQINVYRNLAWCTSYSLLSASSLLLCFFLIYFLKSRFRLVSFGLAWFFVALAPIYPISLRYSACRYAYLASIGYFIVAAGLLGFQFKNLILKKYAWLPIFFLVVLMIQMTQCNNIRWRDGISLWNSVLTSSPQDEAFAKRSIAVDYLGYGMPDKALLWYKKLRHPYKSEENEDLRNEMGACYYQIGKYDIALHFFRYAVNSHPDSPAIWANLGCVYGKFGLSNRAILCFEKATALNPNYVQAHIYLGISYYESGDIEKARYAFERALHIHPTNVQASDYLKLLVKTKK